MKKQLILMLAVLVAICSACSHKATDYSNAIPADAKQVFAINLAALAKKADLAGSNKGLLEDLKRLIDSENVEAQTKDLIQKIMASPAESGIDFLRPAYCFASPTLSDGPSFVLKTGNRDKLAKLFEQLEKENICTIEKGKNLSFCSFEGYLAAFNQDALLVVPRSESATDDALKETAKKLLKQDKAEVKNAEYFKQMQKKGGDICFYSNVTEAEKLVGTLGRITNSLPHKDELFFVGNANFENGKLAVNLDNYTANQEVKAFIADLKSITPAASGDLLKYFPKSFDNLLSFGLNGEKLLHITQSDKTLAQVFSFLQDPNIKALIGSLKSDVAIGLGGEKNFLGIPSILAYADVTDGSALRQLYENRGQLLPDGVRVEQTDADNYVVQFLFAKAYVGVKDGKMYVTTDKKLYQSAGQEVPQSLALTSQSQEASHKNLSLTLNTESLLKYADFLSRFNDNIEMASVVLKKVSGVDIADNGSDGATLTLNLRDANKNALQQILEFGYSLYKNLD